VVWLCCVFDDTVHEGAIGSLEDGLDAVSGCLASLAAAYVEQARRRKQ
jgi:hypothetical protein